MFVKIRENNITQSLDSIKSKSNQIQKLNSPGTDWSFDGQSMDDVRLSASPLLSFVFLGDEAQFLFGDVEAGTVTPGITGRLAGGVLAKGD